ncbi:MAG: sel1 repeat family protein [Campylobacterales bacterium]|nr:sel1 repeat family protein [Campylobacterales bacterium]HEO98226.1 sel1 repeat family protein [Campylobacterota bacterium]
MKRQIIIVGLIVGLVTTTMQARTLEEAVAACEKGDAGMCIGLGKDFKKRNNPQEAEKYFSKGIKVLETKCEENNPDACFSLAQLHARGDVLKENKEEAKKLFDKSLSIFQKACDNKDEDSCMMVDQIKMHVEMM